MSNKLSNTEIKKRLLRLNNLEMMYARQVEANKKLKKQVKKLKQENEQLRRENRLLRERVEKLELIVEEMQKMIFKSNVLVIDNENVIFFLEEENKDIKEAVGRLVSFLHSTPVFIYYEHGFFYLKKLSQ